MLHELPLVIFTIAAQMSAGSFIVLGLINLLGIGVKQETMEKVTNPALYAIGPLMVLGFVVWPPLGFVVLGYIIWGEYLGGSAEKAQGFVNRGRQFARDNCGPGKRWGHSGFRNSSSGNAAFDDYREEQLRRLDEVQAARNPVLRWSKDA